MESILARALEYTLKYWLKSFSRDQFKLQGRTVQLSNLDLNGDALHSSVGLPPALNVATAKVGKLEIMLPSVSNVQIEPIIVQIDRLDLVLEENSDFCASASSKSAAQSTAVTKGSGYGFADKIADGMTIQIHTVNLLLETRGGARRQGGATWAPPMASITIRNLLLYTTNENWQVVNLKEAREFSSSKYIYVFKKLEWESLSIDLLPHPDMFTDATLGCSPEGANLRDDDGAKRVFFGGERFLEGISGEAYITIQRTELNSPLGLEVQLHITEAVCPALSEPGLRALLRFMTGLYVCLNRGDVDSNTQKQTTEAAGRSLVSIVVDHIFLCIKDTEFQLELLMQSLFFNRASVSEGDNDNNLTRITIGGLFLRDPFSSPPCTLVQPSMQTTREGFQVPEFARSFCPPIYPLGEQQWQLIEGTPLISIHSLQIKPSPLPPSFASQTVVDCQPLMIHLQEDSCLRIASFLADGIVVNPGDILPDFSVNSFIFSLKALDVTVPFDKAKSDILKSNMGNTVQSSFTGARLHIGSLSFLVSPSLKLKMLNLEKDPACFCFWEGQPIDASQKRWTARASHLTLSLEACTGTVGNQNSLERTVGLWRCVDLKDACIEVAMATADGSPLLKVPPPGGIVRIGVACNQFISHTSVEQLFFVLDLYAYFGNVSEKIAIAGKSKRLENARDKPFSGKLIDKVPSDTAVSLAVKDLQLRFLEPSSMNVEGMPLVQFVGDDLFISATHRTLGGAIVVSSTLHWESVEIDCVDAEEQSAEYVPSMNNNRNLQLRAVFWVHNKKSHMSNGNAHSVPFLDISMVHVIPLYEQDMESHSLKVSASVSGVRLGGGMNFTEALLHRFGILGPDGGPGEGLSKGLENLQTGPLAKLFKTTSLTVDSPKGDEGMREGKETGFPQLKQPDDVDVVIELKDWLFALEGAQDTAERWWFSNHEDVDREDRCWHTTFSGLRVNAKSSPRNVPYAKAELCRIQQYPVEVVTVGVEGLQILKPHTRKGNPSMELTKNGVKEFIDTVGGIGLEVRMLLCENDVDDEMANWLVENLKFSVKQPIEAVVTKDELQHLTLLCKSEIDSMGRIAAGVLRVLKLEASVGQSVIDQLSNLGSEGIDKIFSSEKLSRDGSVGSIGLSPSQNLINESPRKQMSSSQNLINQSPRKQMEPTISLLEEAVLDSQTKLNALITDIALYWSSVFHQSSNQQTWLGAFPLLLFDIKQFCGVGTSNWKVIKTFFLKEECQAYPSIPTETPGQVRTNLLEQNFHNLFIIWELVLELLTQVNSRTDERYNEHNNHQSSSLDHGIPQVAQATFLTLHQIECAPTNVQ
ncbi:UHRF1-binding protein 1-like [Senna tora]|uniref:UHRF1-binding protein 1-like n=1 Tax=Senna tora TaxID=362788 RepID=A0A834WKP1_9FABA|nr:UHRF1-binding protein 1-like [Senna tora]